MKRKRLALAFSSSAVAVAALAVAVAASAQSLIGKWWVELDGVPVHFKFTDCGILEIDFLGTGGKTTYQVKDSGPPLQLEICPTEGNTDQCSSVHVYLLGGDTLQWVPDADQPLASKVLLTDMLLQRETAGPGELACKPKPREPQKRE